VVAIVKEELLLAVWLLLPIVASLCANACKGVRLAIIIIIAISSAKTATQTNEIMLLPVMVVIVVL
jgi:hypothetical protein